MAAEIHVGDVGTAFRDTVLDEEGAVIDLSSATELVMWFEKPAATDGDAPEVVEYAAELVTDGTDGKVQYVVGEGDLDRAGRWRAQFKAVVGTGTVHGSVHKFKVLANLGPVPV